MSETSEEQLAQLAAALSERMLGLLPTDRKVPGQAVAIAFAMAAVGVAMSALVGASFGARQAQAMLAQLADSVAEDLE